MKLKRQLLVLVAFCFAMAANAQTEVVQGKKVPQLTTAERNTISAIDINLAKGQVIYNTETNCLEFWNGTDWVPQCGGEPAPPECGAFIAQGVWKKFMCHNLGADYSLDPFTPAAGIHGAKYKWGTGQVALTQEEDQSNSGAVSNWATVGGTPPSSTTDDWDMTTANPCPTGFRVPTRTEWDGVISNNTWTSVGDWTISTTNYSSGMKVGTALFLPTTGSRRYSDGAVSSRGGYGYYWSSTVTSLFGDRLYFDKTAPDTDDTFRSYGYPIRCIAAD